MQQARSEESFLSLWPGFSFLSNLFLNPLGVRKLSLKLYQRSPYLYYIMKTYGEKDKWLLVGSWWKFHGKITRGLEVIASYLFIYLFIYLFKHFNMSNGLFSLSLFSFYFLCWNNFRLPGKLQKYYTDFLQSFIQSFLY